MRRIQSITLITVFAITGLLVCVPPTSAVYIQAYSLAGYALQTYPQQHDWTDGWNNDYVAEVFYANPGAPITVPGSDYGYTKASLTESGVEFKNLAYGPDTYARSYASISDYFTVQTLSGSSQSLLDAVMNYELTGSISVFNAMDSEGDFTLRMMAVQDDGSPFGTRLDYKEIDYTVARNLSGQYVGTNAGDLSYPYPVSTDRIVSTTSGQVFYFDIPVSLDLDDMQADVPVRFELSFYVSGTNAVVDFSNTFASSMDNPFAITSSLPGFSYQLATDYVGMDNVSLFGNLDGSLVTTGPPAGTPVPEPSAIFLLGSGLIGLALYTRKRR